MSGNVILVKMALRGSAAAEDESPESTAPQGNVRNSRFMAGPIAVFILPGR